MGEEAVGFRGGECFGEVGVGEVREYAGWVECWELKSGGKEGRTKLMQPGFGVGDFEVETLQAGSVEVAVVVEAVGDVLEEGFKAFEPGKRDGGQLMIIWKALLQFGEIGVCLL